MTKALTKATNCTFRDKKVKGYDRKKIAGSVPSAFKFVPAPLIRWVNAGGRAVVAPRAAAKQSRACALQRAPATTTEAMDGHT